MGDPDELALVVKALKSGLGGCVEWHPDEIDRIGRDLAAVRLKPAEVRASLIAFAKAGGAVRQVKEQRSERQDRRDYYYKVILPIPEVFKKGLFVEMELSDDDPDYPEVLLVNVHEQK
jgi:hypothetical protein